MADDVSTAELTRLFARFDQEISRAVTRIEQKLDHVTNDHESRLRHLERVDVEKVSNDHEARMRKIEVWMYVAIGTSSAGIISSIWSALAP